jgi:invasion protein IalB
VREREKRRKARQRLCFQKRKKKKREPPRAWTLVCAKMEGKKKKVALRRARVRERNARSNGPHSR